MKKGKRLSLSVIESLAGQVLVCRYPRHNYRGIKSRMEERRILVEQIRDTEAEPLDPETFRINPLLRRSRFLIVGCDIDLDEPRRLYHASVRDWCVLSLDSAMELPAKRPALVAVVEKPEDWTPDSTVAVPPGVDLHAQPSPRLAAAFADQFNAMELSEPQGRWAVRLAV